MYMGKVVESGTARNLKLELRANLYVDLKNDVLPDYSFGLYFIANEII